MRRMGALPWYAGWPAWSVAEAFEVHVPGRDAGGLGGPAGGGHPAGAAAQVDVVVGHVGHELAQGGHVVEVAGGLGQPALHALAAPAGDEEQPCSPGRGELDRKSTRLNSSHANISYAV